MTQPDRRHLRRARLALAVVVAAALAAAVVSAGVPSAAESTALASRIRSRSEGLSPPGPQAALVSFALMILQRSSLRCRLS